MAWWDHEDLKDPKDKSDRYKIAFPEGYSDKELIAASHRLFGKVYMPECIRNGFKPIKENNMIRISDGNVKSYNKITPDNVDTVKNLLDDYTDIQQAVKILKEHPDYFNSITISDEDCDDTHTINLDRAVAENAIKLQLLSLQSQLQTYGINDL